MWAIVWVILCANRPGSSADLINLDRCSPKAGVVLRAVITSLLSSVLCLFFFLFLRLKEDQSRKGGLAHCVSIYLNVLSAL